MKKSNFDKFPEVKIEGHSCIAGWENIIDTLEKKINGYNKGKVIVAVECYHGVYLDELKEHFKAIENAVLIDAALALKETEAIEKMVYPFVTDDPVFGDRKSVV